MTGAASDVIAAWLGAGDRARAALAALAEGAATTPTVGDEYAPRGIKRAILGARLTLVAHLTDVPTARRQ